MSFDLTIFKQIEASMEEVSLRKDEIFRCVRDYEKTCRYITAILNRVHSASANEVPGIAQEALEQFSRIKQHLADLSKIVPYQQFYRYNDLWSRTIQTSLYLAEFAVYLSSEKLISPEELENLCGVKINLNDDLQDFHITVEDFLHSFVTLSNELSRLAVNSVTAGDYNRPLRISKFVKELYTGFQLLNLKNDSLRKRFDAIKYHIKKIEEVVYDVSLRKLSGSTNVPMAEHPIHE
ncbi:translin-like protein [Glomus cerebriforme]|uniref:Translin-like protein n=1 Tax=Glomus cerebriforme TaxID=658196 RepID=A0A397TNZ1_9GLOM|nr:translin-like protein [Glomus cerebriforme]